MVSWSVWFMRWKNPNTKISDYNFIFCRTSSLETANKIIKAVGNTECRLTRCQAPILQLNVKFNLHNNSMRQKYYPQFSDEGTGAQRGGVASGKCNPSGAERILDWQSWRAVSPIYTNLRSGHWDPERVNGASKATLCVSLKGIMRTCKFHYILWAWAPGAGRSGILGSVSTSYGTKV